VRTSTATAKRAAASFAAAGTLLADYAFERQIASARVRMEPLGVVGLITPWNANIGFVCSKLSMAIAAGSTAVIKPSELSARQTALLTRVLHSAGMPPGLFNIVTGRGDTVGAEIVRHPDVAKISFTGSTAVGKAIARGAVDTMKRVTLELGGKSPIILLDDADFAKAIPLAAMAATMNSGQACLAGSRLLVPRARLEEANALIVRAFDAFQVGDPRDPETVIGPMVTRTQYERVQGYIQRGIDDGARLLTGGLGRPQLLRHGYFVRPTVFGDVHNDMSIAREEIFGPVLSVIAYEDDEEAVRLANDTIYGLHAYVFSGDLARANRVASRIVVGRVFINGLYDEPAAPSVASNSLASAANSGYSDSNSTWNPKHCSVMNTFSDQSVHLSLLREVHRRFSTRTDNGDDIGTALPWLGLIRRSAPTPAGRGMLQPSMCMIVQGHKEMLVGDRVLRYGPGQYVQTGVAMPVAGRIVRATTTEPYYGSRVALDPTEIAAFMLEMDLPPPPQRDDGSIVTVHPASAPLMDAFLRLLRLLERPGDLPVLGRLIKQEIFYHLLTGPGGPVAAPCRGGRAAGAGYQQGDFVDP
jgi:aldehyde dehydrogenase (NAD+)